MSNDADDVSDRSKAHEKAEESSVEDVLAIVRDDLGGRVTTSDSCASDRWRER